MTRQELLDEYVSLPTEAQRQVADFIAFLRQRYQATGPTTESQQTAISSLHGAVLRYDRPFEPVAEDDWEVV